jgi:hypothetical protein
MPFDGSLSFRDAPPGGDRPNFRSPVRRAIAIVLPGRSFDAAVIQLLSHTRRLIATEDRWGQLHFQSIDGRFCLVGALLKAAIANDPNVLRSAREQLVEVAHWRGFPGIEAMNDALNHAHVLAAIDAALMAIRVGPPRGDAHIAGLARTDYGIRTVLPVVCRASRAICALAASRSGRV